MSQQFAPSQFVLLTGPIFLSSVLNWCLFGILVTQIYIYQISFPKDRWPLKLLVYSLLVIDTAQTFFFTDYAWQVLVAGWGNPQVLLGFTWSSCTIPIVDGLVSIIAQLFFAWRIWMFRKYFKPAAWVSVIISLVSLMQGLSAIVNGIRYFFVTDISQIAKFNSGVIVWLAGSFACDLIIAVAMIIILLRVRTKSFSENTLSLVTSLIVHVVETGTATVVTACLELILFLTMPTNLLHLIPGVILSKVYSNAVLANLNGRLRHNRWGDANVTTTSPGTGRTVDISRLRNQTEYESDMTMHKSVVGIDLSHTDYKSRGPDSPV
ncbi:hypothetical protein M378DRAFT_165463 [Amanita muscaria Koide BX008]|uniref:DUF6534 domain-containing protein n=1 Tax=Amanita muscaria (strain Koide BX008) TaxID=946122 RepID=A0A0C2X0G6_AMAMK|nr:hypothetical protein M378DRAFT_165463 [Amanita muscaria Koide BX008]